MDKIEKQKEHFDKISASYVEGKKQPNFVFLKRLLWSFALKNIHNDIAGSKIKILEPMCGDAEAYSVFHDQGYDIQYSGFDYSMEIVKKLNETRPELSVSFGDVTKFKTDEKFDVIIIIGGLHHVPDFAGQVVRNLSSHLKDGGYFINYEPTSGNPLFRLIRKMIYKKNAIFDETTERDFTNSELDSFFSHAGLRKHKTLYPGLLSYILYYNPYAFPNLNIGSTKFVRAIFEMEKWLFGVPFTKYISFVTLSIWKK